jgi:hypothetical protein
MVGSCGAAIAGVAATVGAATGARCGVAEGTAGGWMADASADAGVGLVTAGTQAAAATAGALGAATCGTAGIAGELLGAGTGAGGATTGLAIESACGAAALTGGAAPNSRSSHSIQLVAHSAISRSHREHRFIHTTPESTDVHSRKGKARTEDDRSELPLRTMWSRTWPRPRAYSCGLPLTNLCSPTRLSRKKVLGTLPGEVPATRCRKLASRI